MIDKQNLNTDRKFKRDIKSSPNSCIFGNISDIPSEAIFPKPGWSLNLTIAQLKCLFYIDGEGSSNQKSIAAVLGVTPPNVTGIIDRLVEQQLVTRHENESNRRMQIIELTPKSKALLSELKERRMNHLASRLDKLKIEDLQALLQGLRALSQVEESSLRKPGEPHLAHQP